MLIGHLVATKLRPSNWTLIQPMTLTLGLLIFGISTYSILCWRGFDPGWSIAKAVSHCANKNWIHISTTPLSALIRDVGALLGLAIAIKRADTNRNNPQSLKEKTVMAILSLVFAQCLFRFPLPQALTEVYYALTLFMQMSIPVFVIAVLPRCLEGHSNKNK